MPKETKQHNLLSRDDEEYWGLAEPTKHKKPHDTFMVGKMKHPSDKFSKFDEHNLDGLDIKPKAPKKKRNARQQAAEDALRGH